MAELSPQRIRAIKAVINQNFTFSDLSPRFVNVDSSTGNIFCPFHENHTTPAAKMYWDEVRDIWVIWCFTEHRHFTAYDYVKLILCEKYQKYLSPLDFLKKNFPAYELQNYLEFYEKQDLEDYQDYTMSKINYINNVSYRNETIADYIETIYTG
jgi:hypothetical protein